jgi:probable F420-dependent oxidoreductase
LEFDLMTGGLTWKESAELATSLESAGFSGMLFTESGSVPWMMIQAAAMAAPKLEFTTGIAVAFPRSPMISAQVAWEIARNTEGRFRLGLGSQVRGHVVRRYAAMWDKPAPQMRDYVGAFKACIRAFRGEEKLSHDGPYYSLSLLPAQWAPPRHDFEDVKIDISAVGPLMCRVAGELCDGVHVHPMHSMTYLEKRLLPAVAEGASRAGRAASDIDLMIPVFAIPGDSPEDRERMVQIARTQIAFYGSTPNYAWDDIADKLRERYSGIAKRVVTYLALDDIRRNPANLGKWGEVAKALRSG